MLIQDSRIECFFDWGQSFEYKYVLLKSLRAAGSCQAGPWPLRTVPSLQAPRSMDSVLISDELSV